MQIPDERNTNPSPRGQKEPRLRTSEDIPNYQTNPNPPAPPPVSNDQLDREREERVTNQLIADAREERATQADSRLEEELGLAGHVTDDLKPVFRNFRELTERYPSRASGINAILKIDTNGRSIR